MDFTSAEFKRFRDEMKKAVTNIESDFGVNVEFGSITYGDNSFTLKAEVFNGSMDDVKKKEYKINEALKNGKYDSENECFETHIKLDDLTEEEHKIYGSINLKEYDHFDYNEFDNTYTIVKDVNFVV